MKIMGLLLVLLLLSAAGIAFAISGLRSPPSAVVHLETMVDQDDAADGPHSRYRKKSQAGSESEKWLTRFELTERSGDLVTSEDLSGQPYVVGFFFTLCPSICVDQNAKVKELQEKYHGQPLRLLSISCDPEVDTPEVLREYAKRFGADPQQWLFLTGKMSYITRVAGEMFFLTATPRFHAEKFVLVDAEGNNVGFYSWNDSLQFNALQRDIDKLLAAGGVMPDSSPATAKQTSAPTESQNN